MQAHQQLEPTNTQDTGEASSSSGEAETPRQAATNTRKTLNERKAWRERNKRLVGNLPKGKTQVGSDDIKGEADGITSKLKKLVTGELRSVWDRLRQVEKSKMPRGPEFTEEEIPLPYTQDLLNARVMGDSKVPKIPLCDGMTDQYDHLDNFRYAMEGRGANEVTKCHMFPTKSQSN